MLKKLVCILFITFFSVTAFAGDKININTATKAELQTLNGIGSATADAIIAYRDEHGAFNDVLELDNVKGIGQKKVEKLSGSVSVAD